LIDVIQIKTSENPTSKIKSSDIRVIRFRRKDKAKYLLKRILQIVHKQKTWKMIWEKSKQEIYEWIKKFNSITGMSNFIKKDMNEKL